MKARLPITYHLRTLSTLCITRLTSSLARLRVSATRREPDREDCLLDSSLADF